MDGRLDGTAEGLFKESGGGLRTGHHGIEVTKTFVTFAIRIVTIDGNPWFVAADVCEALGLRHGFSASGAKARLSPDQYRFIGRATVGLTHISFPNAGATVISESGLYDLVLRSDKKQAQPFRDWVTRDVLPAIRKDGGYILGEEAA